MRVATMMVSMLVLLLSGGALADTDKLSEIKQRIRQEFPDVPSMTTTQLEARLAAAPVLLDVREPDEYAISHLENAVLTPSVEAALRQLEGIGKDEPVVAYCSVGYRSAQLVEELAARGYTNVVNLEGSIFEWANRGLPLYRGEAPVDEVHPYSRRWGRLLDRKYWAWEVE